LNIKTVNAQPNEKPEPVSIETVVRDEVAGGPEDEDSPSESFIRGFIGRIHVSQVENTRLIDISFTAPDPRLAAKVANEIVRTYIDSTLEFKIKTTKDAIDWLTKRVKEEQKKVEETEVALLKYRDEEELVADLSDEAGVVNAQNLAQLQTQLVEMEANRVEAETRYMQALKMKDNPEELDSIPEVLSNSLIQEIKRMEVDLLNQLSELSKKYGRKHPKMLAIRSELESLKERRESEIDQVINSLRNDYKLAIAKEKSLRETFEEQKEKSLDLNRKAIKYRVLKRQAESARHMYDLLINRLKETSLSEDIKTSNIRVIDKAVAIGGPINMNTRNITRKYILFGLMAGIGFVFLLEFLDNTFKNPEEINQYLDIPYLGLIPAYDKSVHDDEHHTDLITLISPRSTTSESYRAIRTSILFSSADVVPQIIVVTSAGPSEGKTSCASNLAVTMSQAGARVLLLDCDMRRPRIHTIFGVSRNVGLSNIMVGTAPAEKAIFTTKVPNLDIIPSGPLPPNSSEILGSKKMRSFLESVRKKYNRIIIDTPPISILTDAVVLSNAADGMLLVIRAGETPRQMILGSVDKLRTVNAHILGAILNGIDAGREGYYYYKYGKYYYYGEGDDHEQPKQKRKKSKSSVLT
jgi:capsular exopolysaccharide synthesis family protein